MKVLISDTENGHAISMENYIKNYCPGAETVIRIEDLQSSVNWAVENGVDLICRATTGLTDYRNRNEGELARQAGIGIVHAHGSNSHVELGPSGLDVICAVGCGDNSGNKGSYGAGLEFYVEASTQSEATGRLTGMIAALLTAHPEWNFNDARAALRQTASYYQTTGWQKDGGFGMVDFALAEQVETPLPFGPNRITATVYPNGEVYLEWQNFEQSGKEGTIISFFYSPPQRQYTPEMGLSFNAGTGNCYTVLLKSSGKRYAAFFTKKNDYSRPEIYQICEISLESLAMQKLDKSNIETGKTISADHMLNLYRIIEGEEKTRESVVSGGKAYFELFFENNYKRILRGLGIVPRFNVMEHVEISLRNVIMDQVNPEFRVLLPKATWEEKFLVGSNNEALIFIRETIDGFATPFHHQVYPLTGGVTGLGTPVKIGPNYEDCVRYLKWWPQDGYREYAHVAGGINSDPMYEINDDFWFEKAYDGENAIFGWDATAGPNARENIVEADTDYMVIWGIRYQLDYDANNHALFVKYGDFGGGTENFNGSYSALKLQLLKQDTLVI
ncbi:MAG: hypothetical protein Kow0037_00670 [Calditrichia bacterium]